MCDNELRRMLTVAETGKVLRCGRRAVYRLIHTGRLRATRISAGPGRWLVFADSVAKLLGLPQRRTGRSHAEERESLRETRAVMVKFGIEPGPGGRYVTRRRRAVGGSRLAQ
jgi:excisionase family DNA binding protein